MCPAPATVRFCEHTHARTRACTRQYSHPRISRSRTAALCAATHAAANNRARTHARACAAGAYAAVTRQGCATWQTAGGQADCIDHSHNGTEQATTRSRTTTTRRRRRPSGRSPAASTSTLPPSPSRRRAPAHQSTPSTLCTPCAAESGLVVFRACPPRRAAVSLVATTYHSDRSGCSSAP